MHRRLGAPNGRFFNGLTYWLFGFAGAGFAVMLLAASMADLLIPSE